MDMHPYGELVTISRLYTICPFGDLRPNQSAFSSSLSTMTTLFDCSYSQSLCPLSPTAVFICQYCGPSWQLLRFFSHDTWKPTPQLINKLRRVPRSFQHGYGVIVAMGNAKLRMPVGSGVHKPAKNLMALAFLTTGCVSLPLCLTRLSDLLDASGRFVCLV
jgi:hypothetical protein